MIKKIVFDLDNTLLFLSDEWEEKYKKFMDKYNLNISANDLFLCIGNFEKKMKNIVVSKQKLSEYVSNDLSIDFTIDMILELSEIYNNTPLLNTDTIYDALNYLSEKYELIAYTNWFTDDQIKRLKKYDLDKFFTKVYGWDILPKKPSKEGLSEIIKNDDIENYIFIGDSIELDLEVPYSIGIATIFYNRKNIKQNKYKEIFKIKELKNIL
ncbi:MAG: HAD family hydrolase [Clostridia bacterium]|nr:HAD family hydrolase [Clostridia bacterium]